MSCWVKYPVARRLESSPVRMPSFSFSTRIKLPGTLNKPSKSRSRTYPTISSIATKLLISTAYILKTIHCHFKIYFFS